MEARALGSQVIVTDWHLPRVVVGHRVKTTGYHIIRTFIERRVDGVGVSRDIDSGK